MKKICLILAFALAMLTSCNLNVGFGNFTFSKIHIDTYNYSGCYDIVSWNDTESPGIEVRTKEYGSIYASEGTYILIEDKCPICD